MEELNIIKSYLVALGFKTDMGSYDRASKTIDDFGKKASASAADASKQYGQLAKVFEGLSKSSQGNFSRLATAATLGATTVASAMASIAVSTVALVDHAAQADLSYQKFALRMYMGEDQARRYKIALDAIGESAEDIAWIPELGERFQKVVEKTRELEATGDFKKNMKSWREFRTELALLKTEATLGFQILANDIMEKLVGPTDKAKSAFRSLNDYITQKIPVWSSIIAGWVKTFVDKVAVVIRAGKDVISFTSNLAGSMTGASKAIAGLGIALGLLFLPGGPLLLASAAIVGIINLIQDFYSYIDGKNSSQTLAPIWEKLIALTDDLKPKVEGMIGSVQVFFDTISQEWHGAGTWKSIKSGLEDVWYVVQQLNKTKGGEEGWFGWFFRNLLNLPVFAMDTVLRFMTTTLIMADRLGHTMAGTKSVGQAQGLSVVDEITKAWNELGLYGEEGFAEKYNKQRKVYEESRVKSSSNKGLAGIAWQETRGRRDAYTAQGDYVPGQGRAYGKYQFMPETWKSAAQYAGVGANAPMTPENQELVAKSHYERLYKKFGDERLVAAAWVMGEGAVSKMISGEYGRLIGKVGPGSKATVYDYIKGASGHGLSVAELSALGRKEEVFAGRNNAGVGSPPVIKDYAAHESLPTTTNNTTNITYQVGGITVSVPHSGASAEEIANTIEQRFSDLARSKELENSRRLRRFQTQAIP